MKAKFTLIILLTITLSFVSLMKIADSRKRLLNLKSETTELKSSIKFTSFNPHTDIKLYIIQEYPDLIKNATEIIERQGISSNNYSEYKYLIYYLYLLDKHDQIIELTGKNSDYTIISFLYLLPAFLYEKMGFSELALKDYNRFILGTNSIISASYSNTFQNIVFQHKISIARIKKHFLKRSLPTVRADYYSSSYFSVVLNNFFDGISEKRFLAEYRKQNIINPVKPGYNNALYFDDKKLNQLANKFNTQDIPFITYELYAASCNWRHYNPEINSADYRKYKNKASQINNDNDVFLYYLYHFRNGRNLYEAGEYDNALLEFEKIKDMPSNQELEFLRDDAYIFSALSFLNLKDYNSAWKEFINVCRDFENSTSDAKIAGKNFLNDFNYLVETSKYNE